MECSVCKSLLCKQPHDYVWHLFCDSNGNLPIRSCFSFFVWKVREVLSAVRSRIVL